MEPTSKPVFGAVESFADILRPKHGNHIALDGVMDYILNVSTDSAEQRIEWARNALAAAKLVRAELTEAGR
jgi:hypothetical protein